MTIIILGAIILFFIGVAIGDASLEHDIEKDIKEGFIKINHKVYRVQEMKK